MKVTANFPEPCRFVLESFREIYGYDAVGREQSMSAEERLTFHQEHSKPVMDKLHAWLEAQFEERLVEPNSGLAQAISYLLNHWQKLTLFLEKPGVPLDNNLVTAARGSDDVMQLFMDIRTRKILARLLILRHNCISNSREVIPARSKAKTAKVKALLEEGTLNPSPEKVRDPKFQENEFFDPRDLVQVKYEMLRRVSVEKAAVTEATEEYGVSRPTYYQTVKVFRTEGLDFPSRLRGEATVFRHLTNACEERHCTCRYQVQGMPHENRFSRRAQRVFRTSLP